MASGMTARSADLSLPIGRDRSIVGLVGRFRQLEARHIAVALFSGNASKTPLDRALKRLVAGRYLVRLTRLVGGDGGGSAQYIYQLGRAGWRLLGFSGQYWAYRSVNLHTLAIADCYVALCEQDHQGWLSLIAFEPEPGCHRQVASVQLTPDAYVEIGHRQRKVKIAAWLECDRGTEHRDVIKGKCLRYWRAYQVWDDDVFPYVIFVVPDEKRQAEIERIVGGGPSEAQVLFRVCALPCFPQVIHTMAQQG